MSIEQEFVILSIFEQLGDAAHKIDAPFTEFKGDASSVESFEVSGDPAFFDTTTEATTNQAYFVIQAWGVSNPQHQVLINGEPLAGLVIPVAPGWNTFTTVFTDPLLQQGDNTFQIKRNTEAVDNFLIGSVVVHWKQQAATGSEQATGGGKPAAEQLAGTGKRAAGKRAAAK